ncbi:MAG: OprD family porin, partial [Hydrogenimonas sp.]|nr:OprD family porin [Hydrogenimonas sp.]
RYEKDERKERVDIKNLYITPGVRDIRQFDDGAGAIGGANIRENISGYKDPNSLDSALYAFRVDVGNGIYRVRLGYSYIADKGDIVAPWRGFPTGGFTRAMGQYNWYANSKSYMLRFDYDFKKSGVADGLKCMLRYVVEDFDDTKPGVQADADVVNFDVIKRFERLKGLELRFRAALSYGEAQSAPLVKADPTYSDVRVEMNYLF